ncbi:MAG TPA: SDR family oxidoreductase [Gammaproteobacteria bacterium]
MDLNDKVALITGAARGLGAAMARALAARRCALALVDRDAAALAGVRAELAATTTARAYTVDVAAESEVIALYERVTADFGALDVSVANAGILRDGLLVKAKDGVVQDKLSLQNWQAVIDVNLTGVFLCGREAAERMVRLGRGGCIVNISSISRHGNFGQSNYSAAKAGVAALTVVWAKELARHGIRVNAIAPGFVRTEILAAMKPEALAKTAALVPAGRLGEPHEIAHTLLYILENDYLNGRVIEVDGGLRL